MTDKQAAQSKLLRMAGNVAAGFVGKKHGLEPDDFNLSEHLVQEIAKSSIAIAREIIRQVESKNNGQAEIDYMGSDC